MMQHTVRRGDSLWGLACQYLGSGMRWPEIEKFHNEMALGGRHPQNSLPVKGPAIKRRDTVEFRQASQTAAEFLVQVSLVVLSSILLRGRAAGAVINSVNMMPFSYYVDMNDRQYQRLQPGMI